MAEPLKVVNGRHARGFTGAVLELMDEGYLDKQSLIEDLLSWMSEDDVEDFCRKNLRDEDNECLIRYESEVEEAEED